MSIAPNFDHRFEFDLADRLRRALRVSGVGVQDMAEYLGVGRNTVSTWINGRIVPSRAMLRLFALRTGFPLEWLETGAAPSPDGGNGADECAPRDLNPEPTGYRSVVDLAAYGRAA